MPAAATDHIKLRFYKNGVPQGPAFDCPSAEGPYFPAASTYMGARVKLVPGPVFSCPPVELDLGAHCTSAAAAAAVAAGGNKAAGPGVADSPGAAAMETESTTTGAPGGAVGGGNTPNSSSSCSSSSSTDGVGKDRIKCRPVSDLLHIAATKISAKILPYP